MPKPPRPITLEAILLHDMHLCGPFVAMCRRGASMEDVCEWLMDNTQQTFPATEILALRRQWHCDF